MADNQHEHNRDEREMMSLRVDEQSAARRESMPATTPKLTGIIGDKSEEAGESRSGEDTRRRGWYWNWNTMVTQFAPLIGLDGKGLLDSYIVWTDRREDSPFRGYAFPSTTAEANFYGIDRNVLGTINKILVALDLIEIKKSMVHRPDDEGNDWKFPHNTYRVKDHGDNFQLTSQAVQRVIGLALEDQAIYRRVKHIFGSKFKPIDPQNIWYQIIAELEHTPAWCKLREIALEDERRTSERSRKGHARRKKAAGTTSKAPIDSVTGKSIEAVVSTADNDTKSDSAVDSNSGKNTVAAQTSNALETSAAQTSNGSSAESSSDAAPISSASLTDAASTSTKQYVLETTTTTGDNEAQPVSKEGNGHHRAVNTGEASPPDDSRDRELTLRLFDEANEKPVSIAARRVLAKVASDFAQLAISVGVSGWQLTGLAIEEAVSSGSSFVAPKRVREILNRWQLDGVPDMYVNSAGGRDTGARNAAIPVTKNLSASHRSVRSPEGQPTATGWAVGSASDLWVQTCVLLEQVSSISPAIQAQLLSDARIISVDTNQVQLHVTDRLHAVLTDELRRQIQLKINVAARKPMRLQIVTGDTPPPTPPPPGAARKQVSKETEIFDVPGSGMTNVQLWAAVRQTLLAGGDIPTAEIAMWAASSQLVALEGDTFVLGFNNGFLCRRAEHRRADLEREFSYLAGFTCNLEIVELDVWRSDARTFGA